MGQGDRNKKIMIVDDQPDVRASFTKRLNHLGHTVVEASEGKEALEKFDTDQPDLILLDLVMPG
jgi:CheY-like chemotaxis protein